MAKPAGQLYEFGSFRLDASRHVLWRDGEPVHLTSKCFDILLALAESSGTVLSKDELMQRVWPDSFVEEGNLTYNISVLRKALGERADEHRYIVTVPGRGYQFVAGVSEVGAPSTEEPPRARPQNADEPETYTKRDGTVEQGAGVSEDIAQQLTHVNEIRGLAENRPSSTWRQGLVVGALAVVAVAALIGIGWYLLFGRGEKRPTSAAAQHPISKIAVLPLANSSGDPELEYLADGISESLIGSLSQLPSLKVIAHTSSFKYRGKEIDLEQVTQALGVDAILVGRIAQQNENILVSVELVDAREKTQVWGGQYDRQRADLLAIKQELVRDISEKLRLRLSEEDKTRLARGDAGNTEAYELYMRGRHFWNKTTPEGMKKAIEHFQKAIEKDSNYALAYVGLADSYGVLELYTSIPQSEVLPKGRAAAERALQIDNSLAEAHASLGNIEMFSWNFKEAEREFLRAIELKPNYATGHFFYGYYLRQIRGKYDEAMAEFRWAQQLDPLSSLIGQNIAAVYICKGEMLAAIEQAQKVIEVDPSFPAAFFPLGHAYRRQKRYNEAITALEKGVEVSGRWSISLGYLGATYAAAGKRDRARAILNELREKYNRRQALGQSIAVVYAALGDKDQAFAWLEKDFRARSGPLPFIAHDTLSDSTRDALASDPRWDDLMTRIEAVGESRR